MSEGDAGEEDPVEYEFAMKMMHKPTLKRERAIRYDKNGEMQMINNVDIIDRMLKFEKNKQKK